MNILIVSNMYPSDQKPYSGIFVKNQYDYLKNKKEIDISLYALPRKFTNGLNSIFKYLRFYIGFLLFLFKKFDVVHIHFFGYHAFLGWFYKILYPTTNLIVTVHGSDTRNFKKKLFQLILPQINTVIAVGRDQAELIKNITDNLKVTVIPAGIDELRFYKNNTVNKKYDFVFVGSFYEIKGVDILIEAISDKNILDYSYCFVGSGKFEEDIRSLQKNHNVTLKTNQTQNEIRDLLNEAKFLVLPSRGDSFGLVVSEAMYCGTPAIVSNIGGVKDQVKNGFNGFVLSENAPQALAETMHKAIDLTQIEYSKLSNNALLSNKQFSLENTIVELKKIYQS